jgi:glycolate oxidase FAD binding subunit
MKPVNERELAQMIREAQSPLDIQGGGTRGVDRPLGADNLSLAGLTGVSLYEPGALTLVAQAGTALEEIEELLASEGQRLAFEPYDLSGVTGALGRGTIGGVFATNASGARRLQVGAARDFLLGVRFVDGMGEVIKNGGRVMKNVTGYDLVKLLAGSYGRLGVLSEVSLKVMPKPELTLSLCLNGLSDEVAVKAMACALRSPYDVSGAVHMPADLGETACTMIRIEGFERSVQYRSQQLREQLGVFGEITCIEGEAPWQAQRKLQTFSKERRGTGGALWQVSMKPSQSPEVIRDILKDHQISYSYDWAGGRVWAWMGGEGDLVGLHHRLQADMAKAGGHATLIYSSTPLNVSRFQPLPAPLARINQGLCEKFDPRSIFNPSLKDS